MTGFNTNNPLPSSHSKDLYDNSVAFDQAMNSVNPTFTDRFGNTRTTWASIEASVASAAALASSTLATYYVATKAVGDTLAASLGNGARVEVKRDETRGNQTVLYTVDSSVLANPDTPGSVVNNLVALQNYGGAVVGQQVKVLGRVTVNDGGTSYYEAVAAATYTDGVAGHTEDGSFVEGVGVQWKLIPTKGWNLGSFGGVPGTDLASAAQGLASIVNTLAEDTPVVVTIPAGDYTMSAGGVFNKSNITVWAHGARIVPTENVTLFDFHGEALPDGSLYKENINWFGGYIDWGEAAVTLETLAIKANSCKSVNIGYLTTRGVKYPIEVASLNDVTVGNCKFRNYEKAVHVPNFLTGDVLDTLNITECEFTCKAPITARAIDLAGGAKNVTVDKFRSSFVIGEFLYARTDTGGLENLTISNGSIRDGDNRSLILVNDNSSGVPLKKLRVSNVHGYAAGATVINVSALSGNSVIENCGFHADDQIGIYVDDLQANAELTIRNNEFAQTTAAGGAMWSLTADGSSQTFVESNNYAEALAPRMIDDNTRVTYTHSKNYTVASGSTIDVESDSNIVDITGTTTIETIVNTWKGHRIVLIFQDALTVIDGSNLALNTDFVTTPYDTLTLINDGTKWVEMGRTAN